ncbi:MAG: Hpt domain-containing protein [Bdellovibrionales bacterium]|nr:Hpt domain-containing protein [Bdellovibrionales bacterium]
MLEKRGPMDTDIIIPDEARQRYLERRKKDIESLRSALSSRTFDEFKRIGHQLKGNAASFGYGDLEKVAIQLEAAGQSQDLHEAGKQVELLEQWLRRTSLGQTAST